MDTDSRAFAGFWRRFAAYIIDYVFIAFVTFPILQNLLLYKSSINASVTYNDAVSEGMLLYGIFQILFTWCYFAGMESSPIKATLGKLAVGIYVVDYSRQRLGFGRATGRHFGKILSGAIFWIGYMMAGFTNQKQALHDMMAETLVVIKENK